AGAAVIFALLLAFIGIWLSAPLGTPGVTIALSASVVLFAYDMKLKGIPFVGNLSVASLGGLAFVYGGVAGESVTRSLLPAVFAILFHFGRELIKDSADIKGDNAVGIKTAATVWGVRPTCRLAAIALGILAIITAVPFVAGYFGLIYLTIIILGVWPALIFSIKVSLADTSQKRLYAASLALKFAMPAGIIAVLAGFQGL
ncbi:MAG: UbiA family prenyltransferase, partial [Candidatus Latescibacteria bacterium]|nr:UbiA family prenyltransferase [Candidatus Latescibacterota bacterium]